MFDKVFIQEFQKASGIDKLTDLIQSLANKVDDLTHSTDLKTYSLKQAQEVSGIDWQAIRRACINNELKYFKNGNKYQVTHGSLREYLDKKVSESNPLRKVG
jgi:hypothetical protein